MAGALAQVFDGFEERHRHEARVAARPEPFDRDAAQPRQADHGQHIFHGGGAADDVVADGFGRAAVLDFGDHAEGFEHARRFRRRARRAARARWCRRWLPCRACGVNARVLADVERVQMEAEGAHLQDERIDERARDAQAAIGGQRGAQSFEIVEKFVHRAVGGQHLGELVLALRQGVGRDGQARARAWAGCSIWIERALDARLEADDEAAIVLELVLLAEDLRLGRVHLRHVGLRGAQAVRR